MRLSDLNHFIQARCSKICEMEIEGYGWDCWVTSISEIAELDMGITNTGLSYTYYWLVAQWIEYEYFMEY